MAHVDDISDIVALFETEWRTPFYRCKPDATGGSMGQSLYLGQFRAPGLEAMERDGEGAGKARYQAKNLAFLARAKDYSVPVLIFTNEDPEDIAYNLERLYEGESLKRSFVFVQPKHELLANGSLNLDHVREWVKE